MERRCPHCGEYVSGNNLNCPSCFKDIPRNIERTEHTDTNDGRKGNASNSGSKRSFVIILALLFGAFGFMGLGHLYIGEHKKGALFLIISLPMMIIIALLVTNIGNTGLGGTILILGALLITGLMYAGLYILHAISIMVLAK